MDYKLWLIYIKKETCCFSMSPFLGTYSESIINAALWHQLLQQP